MRRKLTRALITIVTLTGIAFTANAQQKSLLWQITGKGIKQPTYLYGTIHLFDTTAYKVPAPVVAKLSQVHRVYFELDFDKVNSANMMSHIFLADTNKLLNKVLDKQSLEKLQAIIKTKPMLAMLGGQVYHIKPIFIATMLYTSDKSVTIDLELYRRAKALRDSVGGVETMAEQMKVIDELPFDKQVQMLKDELKTYTTADEIIRKMTDLYVKQDVDRLLQELNSDSPLDPDFNEILLTRRNHIMAERISKLIGSGNMMVAVGAGHLGGPEGLIRLLRDQGYKLAPIAFTFAKAQ